MLSLLTQVHPAYSIVSKINRQIIYTNDIFSIVDTVNSELSKIFPSLDMSIEMEDEEPSDRTYASKIPVQYGEKSITSICIDTLIDNELYEMLTVIADSLAVAAEHLKLKEYKANFQEQVKTFRAVLTTLHSRLNVEEVLEKILTNLGTVLQYKASNIHLLDVDSNPKTYRIVHNRGYKDIGMPEPNMGVSIPLDNMPIYVEMMESGKPYIVSDTYEDPDWTVFPETDWIRSYASAPIRFDDNVIGFINIDSDIPKYYTEKHAEILQLFADEISVILYNARLFESAQKANKELSRIAHLDGLTKIANRRSFDIILDREIGKLRSSITKLSLIIVDIDYFKNYNDSYGHLQGDRFLIKIAGIMNNNLKRANDLICRYGGEEFAIILPDTDKTEAFKIAETIRIDINNSRLEHNKSEIADHVTCSFGITTASSGQSISIDRVIHSADRALYRAKESGRNRICISEN